MDATLIAPDGSPVLVFDALPAGPAVSYVLAAVAPGAMVVDLGCGAGRLAVELSALGHPVVGVDLSPAMLGCFAGPRVCADIAALPLHGVFGGVVLASYLVNANPGFLTVCRALVAPDGAVVVQRFDPVWASDGVADAAEVGPVTVAVSEMAVREGRFTASVRYSLGGSSWDQAVDATLLDDDAFTSLVESSGLRFDRWLDEHRTWARLIPS